jgi:hypothetical protein
VGELTLNLKHQFPKLGIAKQSQERKMHHYNEGKEQEAHLK